MINEDEFINLLKQPESETLDFKRTGYDLSNDESQFDLIKDVLCMTNTPRSSISFIILGVNKYPNGTYDLLGIADHPDEADLQAQFTDLVHPIPDFAYYPMIYDGKSFGIIVVPPTKKGPCLPVRDKGRTIRKWRIYFRRGSRNDIAERPEDVIRIVSWFGKEEHISIDYEGGDPTWDRLLTELYNFDPTRYYILVASPCSQHVLTNLSALGHIPWVGVFDLDPDSDQHGLLSACRPTLETHRSIHLVTFQDKPTINLRTGTYWFFVRGLKGRSGTVELGPWRTWQKVQGAKLSEHVQCLAAACTPTPTTFLVLCYDTTLIRHLQSLLDEVLKLFGDVANITIVTNDPAAVRSVANDAGATILEIPLHQLCSGLSSLFASRIGIADTDFSLPSSSGAPVLLPAADRAWIEEELDLVHLGVGLVPPSDRTIGRDFLRGAEISWYDLGLSYDIERDLAKRLYRRLETDLNERWTSRVNLYHAPGAGGTTLARRMLWNFHHQFPCAILRRTNPPDTAERIFRLTSLTGLPMLLLVDGAEVSERQIDELYDYLRSRQIPIVLLQVLRRFNVQTGSGCTSNGENATRPFDRAIAASYRAS
jgi:Schlafen, AlbA_2